MTEQDQNIKAPNQSPNDSAIRGPDMRRGPGPELMGASTLIGDHVRNKNDEDLGDIKEIMLDTRTGAVSYAVLSFGGFLGMGDKLFAVPWDALTLDPKNKGFTLDIERVRLQHAPGFDKSKWPDMSDPTWAKQVRAYFGSGGEGAPRL